jgi:hypothetical protein
MDEDDELADTNNEELYEEDGNEVISENEGEEQTQEGRS